MSASENRPSLAPALLPPIAFLGAGQMAEAFLRGLLAAGLLDPRQVWIADVRAERIETLAGELGVQPAASNLDASNAAELMFLAVKPQDVRVVLEEVGPALRADQLLISIAAGIRLETLERLAPRPALIRVMPNTPALVQAGMAVLALGRGVTSEHEALALRLFNAVGRGIVLPEEQLDAVTALSGSGPGFLALIAEALGDAGARVGLQPEVASLLVAQTLLGTGRLLVETGVSPSRLKEQVASPGGTTLAGLATLEAGGLRELLAEAVAAANQRSIELGQALDT